jgi:heme oxygenase
MSMSDTPIETPASRSKQLKADTHATHDKLDNSIMAANPFGSRETYAKFLRVQHAFHREIDALYDDETLGKILPDLTGRRRVDLIAQDLADLGHTPEAASTEPAFKPGEAHDIPSALGWLYVAEGSNLGAAFLLKAALQIGLSETFGARHLAAAPEGRGLHWRTFTAALDTIPLTDEQNQTVVASAHQAFACVQAQVDKLLPAAANRQVA